MALQTSEEEIKAKNKIIKLEKEMIPLKKELQRLQKDEVANEKEIIKLKQKKANLEKKTTAAKNKQVAKEKEKLAIEKSIDAEIAKTHKRERKHDAAGKTKLKIKVKGLKIERQKNSLESQVTSLQKTHLENLKKGTQLGLVDRDLANEILEIHDDINAGYLTQEGIKSKTSELDEKIVEDQKLIKSGQIDMRTREGKAIKERIKQRENAKNLLELEGDRLETNEKIDKAQAAAKSGAEALSGAIGIGSIAPLGIALGLLTMFNAQQEAIGDEFGAMGVTEFRDDLAGASQEFTRMGLEGKEALTVSRALAEDFGIGFKNAMGMADSVGNLH